MAKSLPRIKFVPITIIEGDKEKVEKITVKKAGLGSWKEMTSIIKKLFTGALPEILKGKGVQNPYEFIDKINLEELYQFIPELIEHAADEIIKLLTIGTGLDINYIEENIAPDEMMDLLIAIIEVNGLIKVVEKGKNLMSLWTGKK